MSEPIKQDQDTDPVPLFVDLDGTLVRTDTSVEGSFRLVRKSLVYVLHLPVWLLRGRAHLKRKVSERVPIEAAHLPYRSDFVEFLRSEHENGRRIILATAADESYARAVADDLGFFEDAVGSDGVTDLSGHNKLEKLKQLSGGRFDYAGDDLEDLHVFPHARKAIIAHPVPGVRMAVHRMDNVERVFDEEPRRAIDWLYAIRPMRLPANILLLFPLLLSSQLGDHWLDAVQALLSYCFGTASIALYGELLQIDRLRKLPRGRRGAIAEGRVAIQRAAQGIPILAAIALVLAAFVSGVFLAVLVAVYLVAFVTIQDWFISPTKDGSKHPNLYMLIVFGQLRVLGSLVLLPTFPPIWIIVVAVLAGIVAEAAEQHFSRARLAAE